MSPEYAMDGIFSVKSDVFSFGVLVLEIISGKKNRGVYISNHRINLLGHVSMEKGIHFQSNTLFIIILLKEVMTFAAHFSGLVFMERR